MRSMRRNLALVATLVVALSGSAFAQKKSSGKHVAVGTISSIDSNQVVVSEKVKGKDQTMTYSFDSATQKSGNLAVGTPVTVQYRNENSKNIATTVRERSSNGLTAKPAKKAKKS